MPIVADAAYGISLTRAVVLQIVVGRSKRRQELCRLVRRSLLLLLFNTHSPQLLAQGAFADLSVSQVALPSPVNVGSNLTYTVTVTNVSGGAATGVLISDMIQPGVVFVPAASSAGCREHCGLIECPVGNLAAGGGTTRTIVVRPSSPTTITNVIGVVGNEYDPNTSNNTSILGTVVATVPWAVAFVSMQPATLVGGSPSTGTVTLNFETQRLGQVVNLSSSSALVTVPTSVTVRGGEKTATFTATTAAVSASTSVTISATVSGTPTKTAALTLNPPGPGADWPVVAFTCPTTGALAPAGYALPVLATATHSQGVSRVEFYANADTTPFFTATASPYQTTYTLPVGLADGEYVILRAKAFATTGTMAEAQSVVTAVSGYVFAADTYIAPGDNCYDNQIVIVTGGTLTIDGNHTFAGLAVLGTGRLTHSPSTATSAGALLLAVPSGPVYIGCGASIDVTGKGYLGGGAAGNPSDQGRTYPNVPGSQMSASGSYGGRGGDGPSGSLLSAATYGSLFDPQEVGGGGAKYGPYIGGNGGGLVSLVAGTLTLDGSIIADGNSPGAASTGGSGGGINLTVSGGFSGSGLVRAAGAPAVASFNVSSAAGGRVSVRYGDISGFDRSRVTAPAGASSIYIGGPGTVYFKSSAQTYGELLVDNLGSDGNTSPIPSIGAGTITAVSGPRLTDGSRSFPYGVAGLSIELRHGATVELYRVISSAGSTLTLDRTISGAFQVGDTYQGVLKLDVLTIRNGAKVSTSDTVDAALVTSGGSATLLGSLQAPLVRGTSLNLNSGIVSITAPMQFDSAILSNSVTLISNVSLSVNSLTLSNGSVLTHDVSTASATFKVDVTASGAVTIDSSSRIDVTGKGYLGGGVAGNPSDQGRTYPNVPGSQSPASGSYGGRGGDDASGLHSAATYGSLFDPLELGGGGAKYGPYIGGNGGGFVRLTAASLTLNGSIIANGADPSSSTGGSGGGVNVNVTGSLSGSGQIRAAGAPPVALFNLSSGGGGRVSVRYGDISGFDRSRVTAPAGASSLYVGGAGTVFFKSATQTYGELITDNAGQNGFTTPIPAVGSGTVSSASGATVTDTSRVFPYNLEGLYLEVKRAGNPIPGSPFLIASASGSTITLADGNPGILPGDTYQGVVTLDVIIVQGRAHVSTADKLSCPSITVDTAGGSSLTAANYP